MKRYDHTSRKVRYGVVGLGHIAQTAILPAFVTTHANSELTALVSGDPVKAKKVAAKYKVDDIFTHDEYDDFLRSGLVDAVYIALPNHLHADAAERALVAGVHVLCEKPITATLARAERLRRNVKKADALFMTAYRLHFDPANLRAQDLARSGALGDLRYFSSSFSYELKDGDNIRAMPGGGPLRDIGVYCINAARHAFGEEPAEVFAFEHPTHNPKLKRVEAGLAALMRFPSGGTASFTVCFDSASTGWYELVGTEGSVCLDNAYEYADRAELSFTDADERTRVYEYKKHDQFAPEVRYFSDCILSGRQPETSIDEGVADLRVIDALERSMRTGRAVRIEKDRAVERKPGPDLSLRGIYPGHPEPDVVRVKAPHS